MGAWKRMRHALRFARTKPEEKTTKEPSAKPHVSLEANDSEREVISTKDQDSVNGLTSIADEDVKKIMNMHVDDFAEPLIASISKEDNIFEEFRSGIDESIRRECVDKMYTIILTIERTKRIIQDLTEGLQHNRNKVMASLMAPDLDRKAMIQAQVDALESKVFSQTKSKGVEAYKAAANEKIAALKAAQRKLQAREQELLQEVQKVVDNSHLQARLGNAEQTMSKLDFIRCMTIFQARVRGYLARRRAAKFHSAVRTIQALVRLQRRRAAAQRIQSLQRRQSARRIANQRLGAIVTLQRFMAAKNAISEAQQIAHDLRLAASLRERAANQMWTARTLASAFEMWMLFLREKKRARSMLRSSIEKWIMGRIAYAFKVWYSSTRVSFSISEIKGCRVLQMYDGSRMPLVNLYNGHYVPTSIYEQRPRILRNSWQHMTLLSPRQKEQAEHQQLKIGVNGERDVKTSLDSSNRDYYHRHRHQHHHHHHHKKFKTTHRNDFTASFQDHSNADTFDLTKVDNYINKSPIPPETDYDWFYPNRIRYSKQAYKKPRNDVDNLVLDALGKYEHGAEHVLEQRYERQIEIRNSLSTLQRIRDRHALHQMIRHADATTPRGGPNLFSRLETN